MSRSVSTPPTKPEVRDCLEALLRKHQDRKKSEESEDWYCDHLVPLGDDLAVAIWIEALDSCVDVKTGYRLFYAVINMGYETCSIDHELKMRKGVCNLMGYAPYSMPVSVSEDDSLWDFNFDFGVINVKLPGLLEHCIGKWKRSSPAARAETLSTFSTSSAQ